VDNGKVNASTNGIGCVLEQGGVIFHQPMESHAHVSDKKAPDNMLVIAFTAEGKKMNFFKGKTFKLDKTAKTLLTLFMEEFKQSVGKLPDDYNDRTPIDFSNAPFGTAQLLQCYLTEFLIKLARLNNAGTLLSSKNIREQSANSACTIIIEHMKRNVNKNLTLKELCDLFWWESEYTTTKRSQHHAVMSVFKCNTKDGANFIPFDFLTLICQVSHIIEIKTLIVGKRVLLTI
jgi:hypothetical protein